MISLKLLLVLVIGYLLAGVFFGLKILINIVRQKKNFMKLLEFDTLIICGILTSFIMILIGSKNYAFHDLGDWIIYPVCVGTVFMTTLIVSFRRKIKFRTGKEIALYGLDGLFMEIAQRMMMQPLLVFLLQALDVPACDVWAIILTGIVWCLGITTQNVISKAPFDKEFVIEIFSSFVFSMGIGYVYQVSGFIVLTMAAHASERIISSLIYNKKLRN